MRGDSLRDLYAKTLALLGLALVGALGALVDYWPASQPLPLVAEPLPAPAAAGVAARAESARVGAPALFASGSLTTGRTAALVTRPSRRTPERRTLTSFVPASFTVPAAIDPVPARVVVAFDPPPPPPASIATTPVAALPVIQVAFLPPQPELPAEPVFTPHGSGGYGHGDTGFLSDATEAAKKAGTSIMAGTMKTGASIVDGLRTVGGAVRRGLWRFIP